MTERAADTTPAWRRAGAWIAGAAAALLATSAAQAQTAPVAVNVGTLDSLADVVTYVGMEKGYYKDEGLTINLVKFGNTADMVAPLSTGQLDVASGAPTLGYFNGATRGLTLKLVADKGRNSAGHGFNAIMVRKDLVESGKVKSVADLKGLKIATPSLHSPFEIILESALKKASLKLSDVDLQQLGFPNMMAAFATQVIDGGLMIEPFVGLTVRRGVAVRFLGADEVEPDFQMAGVIYGPAFTEKKSEAATRWLVAYVRSIRDYLEATRTPAGRKELADLLGKYTTTFKDPSVIEAVVFPGFSPDGYLNTQTIKENIDWYADRGLLKTKPKITDLVDYAFLNAALDRVGRKGPKATVE
ncbi:MAG: ABC transporter substrate-binding protein [Rhodospirillales bacterium]